jgi:hypothetical protein
MRASPCQNPVMNDARVARGWPIKYQTLSSFVIISEVGNSAPEESGTT